jgi:hypothetical protein
MAQTKTLTVFFETVDLERMKDLLHFLEFQLLGYGIQYHLKFEDCFLDIKAWELLRSCIPPENRKGLQINGIQADANSVSIDPETDSH